jgi:hypothetical protein
VPARLKLKQSDAWQKLSSPLSPQFCVCITGKPERRLEAAALLADVAFEVQLDLCTLVNVDSARRAVASFDGESENHGLAKSGKYCVQHLSIPSTSRGRPWWLCSRDWKSRDHVQIPVTPTESRLSSVMPLQRQTSLQYAHKRAASIAAAASYPPYRPLLCLREDHVGLQFVPLRMAKVAHDGLTHIFAILFPSGCSCSLIRAGFWSRFVLRVRQPSSAHSREADHRTRKRFSKTPTV